MQNSLSTLNSQLSTLNSQLSILNSQFFITPEPMSRSPSYHAAN